MEKGQEYRNADLSGAARGVWLVKVPKYLSEKWNRVQGSGEVGKLRISKPRFAGGKPEVIFSLSDQLMNQAGGESTHVAKDHKFVLTGMANQTLALLSQEKAAENQESYVAMDESLDRLSVEGKVIQRAECRPFVDSNYMKLKRTEFEQKNNPARQVIQLEKAVVSYKPKTYQPMDLDNMQRKKEEVKKSRLEKDKVQDMLFSAFEKHQYYNVKDLVRITQQPVQYLKEILKELCVYNMKAPHKNMWELKPEFRHYKHGEEGASSSKPS